MPVETAPRPETAIKPEYSHKAFGLVFNKFCEQYQAKVEEISGPKARQEGRFLGLPGNASIQEMGRRLAEVSAEIGEPEQLGPEYGDEIPLKEAVIYSARHLAWSAVMGGLTQRYLDRANDYIQKERHSGKHNNTRLFNERKAAVSLKMAHLDGIKDYFDSGLSKLLGNDSPKAMREVIDKMPYLSEVEKHRLTSGIALEIAAKRQLEASSDGKYKVAYGSPEQDRVGGDLVIVGENDLVFIDLKSQMPAKFAGGDEATDLDYERGYKWLEEHGEARRAVVWAYDKEPVRVDSFTLQDERLAANLEAVAASASIDKALV